MNKKSVAKVFLVLGIFLELSMISFWKAKPTWFVSPLLWLLGGWVTVAAGTYLLLFSKHEKSNSVNENNGKSLFSVFIVFGVLALVVSYFLQQLFFAHPPNPFESDVIPTLQVLVKRLMHGDHVHAPIPFDGWTVRGAYMPLQYLPFVLAEWLHMDYRWLAYLFFLAGIFLWIYDAWCKKQSALEINGKVIVVFVSLLILQKHDVGSLQFSIELLDVAYYLFLAYSFFHPDYRMKVAGLLLCLLSRYAFAFWLPLYGISFLLEFGKYKTLRAASLVIGGVVLFYVLPILSREPMLFIEGMKYYDQTAIGQWKDIPSWYQHIGKPFHLTQGYSTSIYFYDFWKGSIEQKLQAAKVFHLVSNIFSILCIAYLYFRWRKKENFQYSAFLLLSLKFYFLFFYGFFYVPFSYLYWIPFFFSFAILFVVNFSPKEVEPQK
jgi:hypothetical protein